MTPSPPTTEPSRDVPVRVVDCDVHPAPRSPDEVKEYLPPRFADSNWPQVFAPGTTTASPMYLPSAGAYRYDAKSEYGGPGSDPELTARQLFGEARVDFAMLLPLGARMMANPEHEAAVCRANNSWLASTWLGEFPGAHRYRGALRIPGNAVDLAVEEIEHWSGDRRFAQVFLTPNVRAPLRAPAGNRVYHPIYEAAERHGLPVVLHPVGVPSEGAVMVMGTHSYFVEQQSLYQVIFAAHAASLICEGTFDRFPNLRIVLAEGGYSWLVPLMNRLEHLWDDVPGEVRHLQRRPTEYVRDHIRVTTQPVEEPGDRRHLRDMLAWLAADKVLMFSTDYPHWDGDYHPDRVLRGLDPATRDRVFFRNAVEMYGLPETRPYDAATDVLRRAA